MRTFIVITSGDDPTSTGVMLIKANDADEAFGKFLDRQDLDVKEDKDIINSILDEFPVGITELDPPMLELMEETLEVEWYTSL